MNRSHIQKDRIDGPQLVPQGNLYPLLELKVQHSIDPTWHCPRDILRNRRQDGFDSKSHTKRFGMWLTQRLASQNLRRKSPPDGSPSLYIADIDLLNNTMKEDHFQSQGL
jgi:hypothetical protein